MTARAGRHLFLVVAAFTLLLSRTAAAVDVTPYAWEAPRVTNLSADPVLVQQLQEEVQKVLDTGNLAPLRTYYADQGGNEEYWLYTEPGRIITTLAWAYPYLTVSQQTAVRTYVAGQLASATHAPWAGRLTPTTGNRRELHPLEKVTYMTYAFGVNRPTVHTIYGLWLYAFRSGDFATIQTYWTTIKSMYSSRAAQGDIYGTMGAHVAMARLADKFSDSATRTTALSNLQSNLDAGVTFATIESRVTSKYFPEMYDARKSTGVYQGWMFLNLSPEIGRYLADNVSAATLARNTAGKNKFPFWWLRRAPYFTRWTGDEGVGIPTEMMGMVMPVERWVVKASGATLRDYVRSGPTGVGDSYWLESVVQAIEGAGTLTWVDVRTAGSTQPPSAPSNLRITP
jgi:hypothetical protein